MFAMDMASQTIDDRIKLIGKTQRLRYTSLTLPTLALEIAEAARRGEINEDDADEVYATYIKESTGLAPVYSKQSFRVNASKIRQIIRCKSPALMKRVMKIHNQRRGQARIRPLYPAMVDACRLFYNTGNVPTDRQLLAIVNKRRLD